MDGTCCDLECAALWLTLTDNRQPTHTPTIAGHVASCPECQTLRASVFEQLLPGTRFPADQCASCDAHLAAYVDMLLDHGARIASATYPQVWWHLWDCVDCAEIFAQTAALADAERVDMLLPLPVMSVAPARQRRVIGRLSVAPQVIARFLQARVLLGVAYGAEEPVVLDDGDDAGYGFQMSVQREPGGTWQILVSIEPPVAGVAVISIGDATFQAPFDSQGSAMITGVQFSLMGDGRSAITVSIEAV